MEYKMPLLAKHIMWPEPPLIQPDTTLKDAAKKMTDINSGVLPVGKDGKIEGIITDRDIVVRAISQGKDPAREIVSDFMTVKPYSCKENDPVRDAAELMKRKNVSRLVVMDAQGKFSGILAFGHIFRNEANAEEATDIITRIKHRNDKERRAAVA